MRYSERGLAISPSMTLEITAKAAEMKAEGINVISFGAGEPDMDTPDYIKDAAKKALDIGFTKYTAAAGTKELRQAVAARLMRKYGLDYSWRNIIISNGAKHSLFNALQACINPEDEVVIIAPYWVTYPELVKMADGRPVFARSHSKNNFEPTEEELRQAISGRTTAIIVTNPSNPCGCVYSRKTLEMIADIAEEFDLHVIADEIYDELVYDGEFISFPSISQDAKNRTILVNGMSKAYAMTGWRMGYTASCPEVSKIMASYQSHSTSNVSSITQYASTVALNGPQDCLYSMVKEFEVRRDLIFDLINQIDGVTCLKPQGAFYVMMKISSLIGKSINDMKIEGSLSFANALLDVCHVAVVPGVAFGADKYVRLSYATSRENIVEGIKRISDFIKSLK